LRTGVYPQHQVAGLVPEIPNAQRKTAMKVKALVIFMVLLGFVIFDGAGMTLSPRRSHPARLGLHNPMMIEPYRAIKQEASRPGGQHYCAARTNHRTIIFMEVLSSPTDHGIESAAADRLQPLRI
jgi:hypothetical protein